MGGWPSHVEPGSAWWAASWRPRRPWLGAGRPPTGGAPDAVRNGIEAFRTGDYERAAAVFGAAARGGPQTVNAPILWGMALVRLGRSAEAVAAFSLAARRAPERATVYL